MDPGSQPAGVTNKLVIDVTTPVRPDTRGHYSQPVTDLPETAAWIDKINGLMRPR